MLATASRRAWRSPGAALAFVVVVAIAAACDPEPAQAPETPTGFPAPLVAGTPETDGLADAPARCGQRAHTWRRSDVGVPVGVGEVSTRTASVIDGLASAAGLELPAPAYFDASAAVMTYQTQDRGELLEATALLAWPTHLYEDEREMPFLLFLHGTQGFTDGCSIDKTEGAQILAQYLASLGFFVVAPDYIGLKASGPSTGFLHPYLVGQATAIASLDAVRAAARLDDDVIGTLAPQPEVVIVGGSQGGHAALWVDRLAPYYARELTLLGAVATVPPADLLGQSERALLQVVNATGNLLAMLGASSSWYDAPLEDALLPPWATDLPAALGAGCDPGDALDEIPPLDEVFQPALLTAAETGTLEELSPFGCMFAENGLTTTSIPRINTASAAYGILFVTGELDELVHTPLEREAFAALCGSGTPLRYLECSGAGHGATGWALPEIVDFVLARRAKDPFEADCTVAPPTRCEATPDGE